MSPVAGARLLMLGGLVLAVVMFVLMRIGTYSESTFVAWAVFGVIGLGLFALGRKLEARYARANTQRLAARPEQGEERKS